MRALPSPIFIPKYVLFLMIGRANGLFPVYIGATLFQFGLYPIIGCLGFSGGTPGAGFAICTLSSRGIRFFVFNILFYEFIGVDTAGKQESVV